jgi:hypothetical protein
VEPRVIITTVSERTPSVRRGVSAKRFSSNDEAERHDAEYWRRIPPHERVVLAWRLSVEQWGLVGRAADEPGLIDLLRAFIGADVRFLIVGAYALAHYGRPRATGDLDVWIDATPANAPRVMKALAAFGAPLSDVAESDFAAPGVVFQIGVPPGRIDIVTELTGLTFAEAWPDREAGRFGEITVDFIGREAFIRNKRATGRTKDLADIENL